MNIPPHTDQLTIIYDGECPVCARYVQLMRVRRTAGDIELINARDAPALVQTLRHQGKEINDGMVVRWRGHDYFGADAMHLLRVVGADRGAFGLLNRALFRHRAVAARAYPLLVAGRRLILKLYGRTPIQ